MFHGVTTSWFDTDRNGQQQNALLRPLTSKFCSTFALTFSGQATSPLRKVRSRQNNLLKAYTISQHALNHFEPLCMLSGLCFHFFFSLSIKARENYSLSWLMFYITTALSIHSVTHYQHCKITNCFILNVLEVHWHYWGWNDQRL